MQRKGSRAYGCNRSTRVPVNLILLCNRSSRPCQNSTTSGPIRYPPQFGGTGTSSRSAKRAVTFASCANKSAREPIGCDCADAHAPSCEPRGRFDQYSVVASAVTLLTGPRTCTCLPSENHGNVADA